MKKILTFIAIFVATIALASCQKKNNTPTPEKTPTPVEEKTPTPEPTINDVCSFIDMSFDYNGQTHSLAATLTDTSKYSVSYEGNDKVLPGSYTVTATVTKTATNEVLGTKTATLKIKDFDGTSLTYSQAGFKYDGEKHSISITNVPSYCDLEVSGEGTEIGTYDVVLTLKDKASGTVVFTITKTLSIYKSETVTLPMI